jgi:hypothetical protein
VTTSAFFVDVDTLPNSRLNFARINRMDQATLLIVAMAEKCKAILETKGEDANLILDIDGAQSMFNEAKKAHGNIADDLDLVDHLDSKSSFEIDLGGQG